MQKRILSMLLCVSMVLGNGSIAFAAETQNQNRAAEEAALPFTFTEMTEDINDDQVKGHYIDLTDDNTSIAANYGGLVVLKREDGGSTDTVYLVGNSGLVRSFSVSADDGEWEEQIHFYFNSNTRYSSVKAVQEISAAHSPKGADYADQLYVIHNPETQAYDIYNGATGEYFEYGLDETPEIFRDNTGESAGVLRILKAGKYGMLAADGAVLYEAEYDDIDLYSYNHRFSDGSLDNLPYYLFLAEKENYYGFIDSAGISDGGCKYTGVVGGTQGHRLICRKESGCGVLDLETGEELTDFTASEYNMYELGGGCYRIMTGFDWDDEILLTRKGEQMTVESLYSAEHCSNADCQLFQFSYYSGSGSERHREFFADADGKKHFEYYVDEEGKTSGIYVKYSSYVGGYAVKLEAPNGDPEYGPTAENPTITCSLVDAAGKTVYRLEDNAYKAEIAAVGDGLVYLESAYASGRGCMVYDTGSNSVVLEEPDAYFYETNQEFTTNGGHLLLLRSYSDVDGVAKYALFNIHDKTFSGWDALGLLDEHGIENFEMDSFAESIVGADIVFQINGTLYNGSFQPVGELKKSDFVTENGNFVSTGAGSMGEGYYEVYDRKGLLSFKYQIPVNTNYYSSPSSFTWFAVREGEDSLWGYCDEDGVMQIEPQFTHADSMRFGVAKAEDDSGAGIVDQNGSRLLWGNYDWYRMNLDNGLLSINKYTGCYLYDFTGIIRDAAENPYTQDDLFGRHHRYLKENIAYKTMHRTLFDAGADVLAARTGTDDALSALKTLSGDVIVRSIKQIFEGVTGVRWEEEALEEEVAIELIRVIDSQESPLESIAKIVQKSLKIGEKGYKYIAATGKQRSISEKWAVIKGVKGKYLSEKQAKEIVEAVDKEWKSIDKVFKAAGLAADGIQVGAALCIMANLQMETINQLLDTVTPGTTVYKGLTRLKWKVRNFWFSAPAAVVQKFIVDKAFDDMAEALVGAGASSAAELFDPLSGIDIGAAVSVGKLFYYTISLMIPVASYDEVVQATYSMTLCNALSFGLNNKYLEIVKNYRDTGKTAGKELREEYKFAYEAYEASLKLMADKCSSLADHAGSSSEVKRAKRWLDRCIAAYSGKMSYANYLATCRRNMNKTEASAFAYRLDDNQNAWITGLDKGEQADTAASRTARSGSASAAFICIPETLDGHTVVGIDAQAFQGESGISGIFLPDTVTDVGAQAFENCGSLDVAAVGGSLERIGEGAFAGCGALTDVELPASVSEIGANAFGEAGGLTLWCRADSGAWQYAEANGISAEERTHKAVSAEILTSATKQHYNSSEESIDTDGLTLRVTWDDGTAEEISSGYFAYFKEKTAEKAVIAVQYDSAETEYEVGITPEIKEYQIFYQDGAGENIAEPQSVSALFGSTQTLEAAEVEGYTPEQAQMTVTAGDEPSWIFTYTENGGKDISSCYVNLEKYFFTYTGSEICPEVVIYDAETYGQLTEGEDYQVFFEDNVELGEAWVGIEGIGAYEGLLETSFMIGEEQEPTPPGPSAPQEPSGPSTPSGSQTPSDSSTPPGPQTPAASVLVSGIQISGISHKIAAGKKITLKAEVTPANVSDGTLVWSSSNPKVATVNSKGVVTVKKGSGGKKVTITAAAADGSGVSASYRITSMKGVVKKISISGKKTVKAGKSIKLTAKVTATKKANTKLAWSSSNEKLAAVKNGKVTAKKNAKGKKVKITAAATDGSGKKKTITIRIR